MYTNRSKLMTLVGAAAFALVVLAAPVHATEGDDMSHDGAMMMQGGMAHESSMSGADAMMMQGGMAHESGMTKGGDSMMHKEGEHKKGEC